MKESVIWIDKNMFFVETFNSYSDIIKNWWTQTWITIENWIWTFDWVASHSIVYLKEIEFLKTFSIRIKAKRLTDNIQNYIVFWEKAGRVFWVNYISNKITLYNNTIVAWITTHDNWRLDIVAIVDWTNSSLYLNWELVSTWNIWNFDLDWNIYIWANGSWAYPFSWEMDSVMIYEKIFTAEEVKWLYNNDLYKISKKQTDDRKEIVNISANKWTVTESYWNELTLTWTEVVNNWWEVISFDWINDMIALPTSTSIDWEKSFYCWVKNIVPPQTSWSQETIFSMATGSWDKWVYSLSYWNNSWTLKILWNVYLTWWGWTLVWTAKTLWLDWHFVWFTRDWNEIKIFYDWEKIWNATGFSPWSTDKWVYVTLWAYRDSGSTSGLRFWNWYINEAKVIDWVLSEENMAREYNATKNKYL